MIIEKCITKRIAIKSERNIIDCKISATTITTSTSASIEKIIDQNSGCYFLISFKRV
jgi:hypothetical protein